MILVATPLLAIIEPFDMESRVPEIVREILDKAQRDSSQNPADHPLNSNTQDRSESSNSRKDDSGDTSSSQDAR